GLEPAFLAEEIERNAYRDDHQSDGKGISIIPFGFRHQVEVHSVNARDQGRGHENDRGHGKYFDDLVLFDVHQTQEGILKVFQPMETEGGVFQQRVDVLDHDPELVVEFARNVFALEHAGDDALFIDDHQAKHHRGFLQFGDVVNGVLV